MSELTSDNREHGDFEGFRSVFSGVTKSFLYLLPGSSGEVLIRSVSSVEEIRQQVNWFANALRYDSKELTNRVNQEGDEEDKQVLLNIFLWKQRHLSIDPLMRIGHDFESFSTARFIHRYMVANGYNNILEAPQPFLEFSQKEGVRFSYLDKIAALLDRFHESEFPEQQDELGDLLLFLSILGPRIFAYPRISEVKQVIEYVLECHKSDPGLFRLSEDVSFASLVFLLYDLGIEKARAWKLYESVALRRPRRGVSSYPAFLLGIQMYGDDVKELLRNIELQGGTELFLHLVEGVD